MLARLLRSQRLHRLLARAYNALRFAGADITLGRDCHVHPRARLRIVGGGRIVLGDGCWVGEGAMLMTYGGDIVVGRNTSFNPYCVVYGHGGLRIGSGVRIAAQTVIVPANHGFDDPLAPIGEQPLSKRGIIIGDDVWLAAGVRVLDGVTIADGCVIAAGAVVARSTEPGGIYAGVPARLLRLRGAARGEDRPERHDD